MSHLGAGTGGLELLQKSLRGTEGEVEGMWYCGAARRPASRDLQWVPQKELGRTLAARAGENLPWAWKPGPFQECTFVSWFENNKGYPERERHLFLSRSTRYTPATSCPVRFRAGRKLRDVWFLESWRGKAASSRAQSSSCGSQPDLLVSKPTLISLWHTPLWCGATVVIEEKSLENECFLKYHLQFIALRISHW